MGARSVGNIIQRGGTILKTARSEEFRTPEGREKAFNNLKKEGINALIAIGGDGTFTGLHKFYEEFQLPSVCIPGTIDNDLAGTDYTIGYDTARISQSKQLTESAIRRCRTTDFFSLR